MTAGEHDRYGAKTVLAGWGGMAEHDDPIHVDTDRARAGATPGMTRYILGASLVLVVIGFVLAYYLA